MQLRSTPPVLRYSKRSHRAASAIPPDQQHVTFKRTVHLEDEATTKQALLPRLGCTQNHPKTKCLPSGPGEFHPRPLTDPDVTVSGHPARTTHRRRLPSAEPGGLLPVNRLALEARWGGLRPWLRGHCPASTLLRRSPPLAGASGLSASRVHRLGLFPWHHR